MSFESRCRACGNILPNEALDGLCPVCLFREGLAVEGSAVETGPFMSGTFAATSAFADLDKSLGGLPHVLLRDSELGDGPGPLVQPGSPEMPAAGARTGRLQLLGEIARGGMGAVLKGRDPDLGRDVAVKVLLDSHRDKPEMIRRFIEEAQFGGQLQHPGIVPIYELGAFEDHRPYFAMKLVKGRTLSSLLDDRPNGIHDLPRSLSIFESVCQTIAYAHARGVIHRDLKPSNIMVGSFGEVQVMDWGLAKVLPQGGVADDASAGKTRETVIATGRSGGESDSDLSRAGSIMGTPSYMAPEQARGEVDRLDERCDVFALGSILCEILTGEPAFIGRSSGEIQRKASRGELNDALERLGRSGSDAELIDLAKDCLAAELEDRPRHAGDVAGRINAYQTGVQERLRNAEIARAEEKTRAEEATKRARVERDRFRLTIALAAAVIGLIVLGVGAPAYLAQVRADRRSATERAVAKALDEANFLRGQAMAAPIGDLSKWPLAMAAAQHACVLAAAEEHDAVLEERARGSMILIAKEEAEARQRALDVDRDRTFLERLEMIAAESRERGSKWADSAYESAFKDFGLDLNNAAPTDSGRFLASRSMPLEFASYLFDWAMQFQYIEDPTKKQIRLVSIARVADPDPWRNRVRAHFVEGDGKALRRMAVNDEFLSVQPAAGLLLLASVLEQLPFADGQGAIIHRILKRAWRLRPDSSLVCRSLSCSQRYSDEWGDDDLRVRFCTAAVALQPGSALAHNRLARELLTLYDPEAVFSGRADAPAASERLDEVIEELRQAIRLRPEVGSFHRDL